MQVCHGGRDDDSALRRADHRGYPRFQLISLTYVYLALDLQTVHGTAKRGIRASSEAQKVLQTSENPSSSLTGCPCIG